LKEKEMTMDILKIIGLGKKESSSADGQPKADTPRPEQDVHAHGGCCGSCGGQKKPQSVKAE
jgi:hypothetical protein